MAQEKGASEWCCSLLLKLFGGRLAAEMSVCSEYREQIRSESTRQAGGWQTDWQTVRSCWSNRQQAQQSGLDGSRCTTLLGVLSLLLTHLLHHRLIMVCSVCVLNDSIKPARCCRSFPSFPSPLFLSSASLADCRLLLASLAICKLHDRGLLAN